MCQGKRHLTANRLSPFHSTRTLIHNAEVLLEEACQLGLVYQTQCADACKEAAALRAELELVDARSVADTESHALADLRPTLLSVVSSSSRSNSGSSNANAGSSCANIGSTNTSASIGNSAIFGAGGSATGMAAASSSASTASLVAQARASIFSNQAPRQHEPQQPQLSAESRSASRSSSVDLFMPRRVTPPACDVSGSGADSVPGQAPASTASLTYIASTNINVLQSTPASAAYRFVPTLPASTTSQSNSSSAGALPSLVAVAPALPWPAPAAPRRVPLTLAPANAGPAHTPGCVDGDFVSSGGISTHSASSSEDWVRAYSSRRASNVGVDDALAQSLVQRYRASSFSASSADSHSELGRSASANASSAPASSSFISAHPRSHPHSHSSVPPGFMLVGDLHLGDVLLVQASAASSSAVAVAQATSRVFAADTTLRGHASSVHACVVVAIERPSGTRSDDSIRAPLKLEHQTWRMRLDESINAPIMANVSSHYAFSTLTTSLLDSIRFA
jgi:hypothetical protein